MTYRVGPKGQVVLPKALRERHGIAPGDEVVIDDLDGEIRVRRRASLDGLVGMLAGSAADLHADREADRREELERDERRFREWSRDDDRP